MRPSDVEPVVFGDLNDGPNELLRTILDDPRIGATAYDLFGGSIAVLVRHCRSACIEEDSETSLPHLLVN